VSYFLWSGASDSSDLTISHNITSIAIKHNTDPDIYPLLNIYTFKHIRAAMAAVSSHSQKFVTKRVSVTKRPSGRSSSHRVSLDSDKDGTSTSSPSVANQADKDDTSPDSANNANNTNNTNNTDNTDKSDKTDHSNGYNTPNAAGARTTKTTTKSCNRRGTVEVVVEKRKPYVILDCRPMLNARANQVSQSLSQKSKSKIEGSYSLYCWHLVSCGVVH
jgi:hypothetical protein